MWLTIFPCCLVLVFFGIYVVSCYCCRSVAVIIDGEWPDWSSIPQSFSLEASLVLL